MESEYIGLCQATTEAIWCKRILEEIKFISDHQNKATVLCDNKAAIDFSRNKVENSRTKHIDVRYHFVRESVERKLISLEYIQFQANLANVFMKNLKRVQHQEVCKKLRMCDL